MLVLSAILFVIGCVLVLCFALMYQASQKSLAAVESEVREEIDRKTRAEDEVDAQLVGRVCDGKSLSASVGRWKTDRAAILETGRTKEPWRWTEDDLRQWSKERIKTISQAIRRKYLVATVVTSVCAVLVAGTVGLIYYYSYAQQRSGTPIPQAFDAGFAPLGQPLAVAPPAAPSPADSAATPEPLTPPSDVDDLLSP